MLINRAIRDGVERVVIDDTQAVFVLERDAHKARVLSWSDRNDERPMAELQPIAASCASACARASHSVRPTAVELTIDRRRQDVHWWAMVLRLMAQRPEICARCSLLSRWGGLFWCGVPWPVRQWRRIAAWLSACVTCANVAGLEPGCGCCLNVKWRLLVTPGSMLRRLVALLVVVACGEVMEINEEEAACPYRLWPAAL